MRSEDLFDRPAAGIGEILAFLGLSSPSVAVRPNKSSGYDPMPASLRARMIDYFRPHIARLSDLLGRDLDWDA